MSAPPYMKLYIADYHGDTTHLSTLEHGAYLLLLMAMWRAGGKLPADDVRLAKLAKVTPDQWAEIRDIILDFFTRRGGLLRHKRVSEEMAKYERTSVQRSEAGKRGGSKKSSENSDNGQANASPPLSISRHNQNQNHIYSEDKSSDGQPSLDPDKKAWDDGVALLVRGGSKQSQARAMMGKLVKAAGSARALLPAIAKAIELQTQDPASYLAKAAARIGGGAHEDEDERIRREMRALL